MIESIQCENCEFVGVTDINLDGASIHICANCRKEFSYVWCKKCGIGRDVIRNIDDEPSSWKCEECGAVVTFQEDMYTNIRVLKAGEISRESTENISRNKSQIEGNKISINWPKRYALISIMLFTEFLILGSINRFTEYIVPYGVLVSPIAILMLVMVIQAFHLRILPNHSGGFEREDTRNIFTKLAFWIPVLAYLLVTIVLIATIVVSLDA